MAALLNESPRILPIHRKILAFNLLGWIFDFYNLMVLSFIIASTTMAKDLGLTQTGQGVLLGTTLAFTAVGGLVGGSLADRFGRKPILIFSILLYSLGSLLSGLSWDMATFIAARAIAGIGVGAEWGVAQAMVGESTPAFARGRFGSYLQSGGVFGRFFATIVGNFLAPWIGWRYAFMVSALPALLVLFIQRQMPESDVWLRQKAARKGTGPGMWATVGQMLSPELRKYTAITMALTSFNLSAFWFKAIWLPTYFHVIRGLSLGESASLFFLDQIGGFFGYMICGWSADRFGRRPTFFAFSLIKATGMIMLTFGWGMIVDTKILLWTVMLVLGSGEGNFGVIGPIINELFPTTVRATALGIIYNVSRGVQALAPVAIAFVAARFSFGAGIALGAPFALLAGATVWLLPETRGVKLPSSPGAAPDHEPTPTTVRGAPAPATATVREASR